MPKLGVFFFALVASTSVLIGASADRALAVSIQPVARHSAGGAVSLINCKTGGKNCTTGSRLQTQLQGNLKKAGEVGGTDIKCSGSVCGNCATDPTNCGDLAAKRNGGTKVTTSGASKKKQ